jgi:uncharacterized membrane protein
VTPERRTRSTLVALALLAVTGAAASHYAIALGQSPTLGALVALVPLAALVFIALRRSGTRGPLLWIFLAASAGALWLGWDALERHFESVYFLEHVGTNLLLGAMFGRTLFGEAEPLCSRFARLLHGPLPPEVALYTRRVTVAWTAFFLCLAAISSALFLGGLLAAWSVLANFLTLPLVGAMFVVEYAIRGRVLRDWQRGSILDGLRAFRRHSAATRLQA